MLLIVYLCESDCKINPHVCLTQEHVPLNSPEGMKDTKQVGMVCLSWGVGLLLVFGFGFLALGFFCFYFL